MRKSFCNEAKSRYPISLLDLLPDLYGALIYFGFNDMLPNRFQVLPLPCSALSLLCLKLIQNESISFKMASFLFFTINCCPWICSSISLYP